ncbi:MAG TPA: MFS transporter [Nonomuraea sp.]|nr:MFS transporter [Nonomuraea sp.]
MSVGGHTLAGGGPVPFPVYLAGVLAVLASAYALNGRERGLPAVLAATVTAQTVLHQLFERLAPAAEHAHAHGQPAPGMTLAHLTVAGLTAWWLHRGERALWLMIRLYAAPPPAIRLLVAAPVPVAAPAWRPVIPVDVPAEAGRVVTYAIGRRGPPGGSC